MTTAVTYPAGHGSGPAAETVRARAGDRSRAGWRPGRLGAVVVVAVVIGGVLVASDLQARSEIRAADVSVASAAHRLSGLPVALSGAEQRLAVARAGRASVTRSFDAVQSSLSATQAALSQDQTGIHSQGVDLGKLDICLSSVEQALNQLAVGQTAGGLASLRASSGSCAALDETG
jgi:hypothetical protein